jgi:hypothetical protein
MLHLHKTKTYCLGGTSPVVMAEDVHASQGDDEDN